MDHFGVLRRALDLQINDLKKLCLQLRLNAADIAETITMLLDDEALLGYQPSAKKKKMLDEKGS